jgi:type I restriction enzyme S subunit
VKWPTATLGEIAASVEYGLTASAISLPEGPKFLRITDIQNDHVDWESVPFCKATQAEEAAKSLAPGDIVFARTGATTGKSFLLRTCPARAVFASYLIRVRPSARFDPVYLSRFFQSETYWAQIRKSARGAAQPGINSTVLKELLIPLPPLDEQQRIAEILDEADNLRHKRREALAIFQGTNRAIFLEMFGDPIANNLAWPTVHLGDVGTLERGVSKHRPRNDPALLGGPYPLIQTGEVTNSDGYIRTFTSTYSDLGLRQSKLWRKGTLCITIAANIGKTGILTFDACFPDSVVGFAPGSDVRTEFVQQWLEFVQPALERDAPQFAQKNINLAILRDLSLIKPPFDLQCSFADRVIEINKIKEHQRAHLAKLDALFASLQHRAFQGEL